MDIFNIFIEKKNATNYIPLWLLLMMKFDSKLVFLWNNSYTNEKQVFKAYVWHRKFEKI